MRKCEDLSGLKFGKLTVIELSYTDKFRYWKCVCDCGNTLDVKTNDLKSGNIKQCRECRYKQSGESNRKNYVGQKFDYLTVESVDYQKGKEPKATCICDCGNRIIIGIDALKRKRKNPKSCGCYMKSKFEAEAMKKYGEIINQKGYALLGSTGYSSPSRKMQYKFQCLSCGKTFIHSIEDVIKSKQSCPFCSHRYKDLTGERFGRLTVIRQVVYETNRNNNRYWLCRCECGNEMIAPTTNLFSGKSHQCRQCSIQDSHKDIVGQRFGKLVVNNVEYIIDDQGVYKTICTCLCDCGNTKKVLRSSLISGRTISCGCAVTDSNFKDRTGDIINNVAFISVNRKANDGGYLWNCKCPYCGQIFVANPQHIKNFSVISCGCQAQSRGEVLISQILEKLNVHFETEYSFHDCVYERPLRFDFCVFFNHSPVLLIEYDGLQHFKSIQYFGGDDGFHTRQICDEIKNQYCDMHDIPLVRIPYDMKYEEIYNTIRNAICDVYKSSLNLIA